ncbi:MAG: hypothetical protein ACI8ZM_003353 [Crocinitomix sp.]|jgi:hypothetical protein
MYEVKQNTIIVYLIVTENGLKSMKYKKAISNA